MTIKSKTAFGSIPIAIDDSVVTWVEVTGAKDPVSFDERTRSVTTTTALISPALLLHPFEVQ